MKLKHILFAGLLLAILTIGAVSASEDIASDDSLAVDEAVDDSIAEVDDSPVEIDDSNQGDDLAIDNEDNVIKWNPDKVTFLGGGESDLADEDNVAYFSSTDEDAVGTLEFYVNDALKSNTTIKPSDYKGGEGNKYCYMGFLPSQLGISTPGIYTIKATLEGQFLNEVTCSVYRDVPIVYVPFYISVGENDPIAINDPSKSGNSAAITIEYENGTEITDVISVVNGQATYSVANLPEGEYLITVNYPAGKGYYKTSYLYIYNNMAEFTFTATPSEVTVGSPVTVTLTGPNLEDAVELYVDGKYSKDLDLSKGLASELLTGLTIGTHKIQVYYDGYEGYYSNTIYVTVKEAPAPTPTPDNKKSSSTSNKKTTTKISLTLKKVKIKKSAKKLVLSATLKINKKAVKGKIIKFKFKGKTYRGKTNKKGVAKVTIKKKVLKKLKVGKKITYKATYSTKTVKRTVKVKK